MKKLLVLGVTLALVAVLAAGLSATERKGMFGADLGGVLTLPMGDFGDAFKMGWRAGANVGYFVTDQIQVGATGAYSQNKVDDTTGVGDAKLNILQFGAFGKYMFKMQNDRIAPYLKTGVGFYNGKASVSGGSSASSTDLGINGGVGVAFAVSPTASVFVEGAYHNIFTDVSSTSYIAANAGLSLMFGKPSSSRTTPR
jgi:opacity protein-like surface antigen